MSKKVGCKWTVETKGLGNSIVSIPQNYVGNKTCYYTNSSISYDPDDAYDFAVYQIFKQLDAYNDGRIIVSLAAEDLEVVVLTVSGLPYMWGPSIMKSEVWQ